MLRGNGSFSKIKNHYGNYTSKLLKDFNKTKTQLAIKFNHTKKNS